MCIRNFDASLDSCQWGSGFWVQGSGYWELGVCALLVSTFVLTFEFWCSDSLFNCFSRFWSEKLRKCSIRSHLPSCTSPSHRLFPSGAAYVVRGNCWSKWRSTWRTQPVVPSPGIRHAGRPSSLEFIFIVLRNFQLLQLYQYMNLDALRRVTFRSQHFNNTILRT